MAGVLQARLTEPVVRKVMLTAHRYVGPEALAAGIVDEVVPAQGSEATIEHAVKKAAEMAPLAESGVSSPVSRLRLHGMDDRGHKTGID